MGDLKRILIMLDILKRYAQEEHGATAIEYGLIATGIGVAIAATVGLIGGDLDGFLASVRTYLSI